MAGETEGRGRTASSLMRRSDTMSSMIGRASSTFISRFSPLLFRDAITLSSLLIISCREGFSLHDMPLQKGQAQCSRHADTHSHPTGLVSIPRCRRCIRYIAGEQTGTVLCSQGARFACKPAMPARRVHPWR